MVIKRFRIFQLRNWIEANKNKGGGEFDYYRGLSKNLRAIIKEIEDTSAGLSDQLEYEKKVIEINNTFIERAKTLQNQMEINDLKKEIDNILSNLFEKYSQMGIFNRTNEIMNEDIEIELYKINANDFPKGLINSSDEYDIIEPIVT